MGAAETFVDLLWLLQCSHWWPGGSASPIPSCSSWGPSFLRPMLSLEALRVERFSIIKLRDQHVISDEVLRRIQRDIDLAEARLEHHL